MGTRRLNRWVLFEILMMLMAISGFVCSIDAAPVTYYVATDGSDSNSGTEGQPFRTLRNAVRVLKPGDTLYLKAGTYAESLYCTINVCIPSGTSWSAPVTIAASPGQTVILRPNSGLRVLNFANAQAFIVVDGLIIDAANVDTDGIQFHGMAHDIIIKNTEIKSAKGQGINIGPDANSIQVMNSVIHDVGTNGLNHGIYVSGCNNTIEKTTIYNISGYGIHVYNGYSGKTADNNIIRKNRVSAVGLAGGGERAGILLSSGSNNVAYNNIVFSNPVGIRAYDGSGGGKIYNNTAYNNWNYGIAVESGATNTEAINNIAYLNGTNIFNAGTGTILKNNLTTDPKFVDAAKQNFIDQSTSPAIDAAVSLANVSDDYDGVRRPQGSGADIGAYETSPLSAPRNVRIVR